jgi:hypothetical protein
MKFLASAALLSFFSLGLSAPLSTEGSVPAARALPEQHQATVQDLSARTTKDRIPSLDGRISKPIPKFTTWYYEWNPSSIFSCSSSIPRLGEQQQQQCPPDNQYVKTGQPEQPQSEVSITITCIRATVKLTIHNSQLDLVLILRIVLLATGVVRKDVYL